MQCLVAHAARALPDAPGGDRWLLYGAASGLALGLGLWLAGGYHAGFIALNAAAARGPDWLWQCLTVLGDKRVVLALVPLFAVRHPRLLWALLLAAPVATLYAHGLKDLCDTVRPPGILAPGAFHLIGPARWHAGFPSGHGTTAGLVFGMLAFYARWRSLRVACLMLAILIGLSRIAVGVHWPVDVACGLSGGMLSAWLGARLAARWPGPALSPGLHLTLAGVSALAAVSLFIDDGGYAEAVPLLRLLGSLALIALVLEYAWPLARCWRAAKTRRSPRPS